MIVSYHQMHMQAQYFRCNDHQGLASVTRGYPAWDQAQDKFLLDDSKLMDNTWTLEQTFCKYIFTRIAKMMKQAYVLKPWLWAEILYIKQDMDPNSFLNNSRKTPPSSNSKKDFYDISPVHLDLENDLIMSFCQKCKNSGGMIMPLE